jgi:hypothetical protein
MCKGNAGTVMIGIRPQGKEEPCGLIRPSKEVNTQPLTPFGGAPHRLLHLQIILQQTLWLFERLNLFYFFTRSLKIKQLMSQEINNFSDA